jgi:regulator of protease activity HflC (stomatin/prohibitin superfamily)
VDVIIAQIVIWLGIIGIIIALIIKASPTVSTFHYGLVLFLGRPTGRVLGPGLNLLSIIPFLESALLESAGGEEITFAIQRKEISVVVFSKPDASGATLKINVKGVVVFRVDIKLVPVFAAVGKDALKGISDGIEKLLGIIAGKKDALEFISKRDQLDLLINCELRMKKPPHLTPKDYEPAVYKTGDVILPENRLEFYERNYSAIKINLKNYAKKHPDGHSSIEARYGIDIVTFDLTHVDFSEETKKSFEKRQQAVADMAGADEVRRRVIAIAKEFMAQGVSAEAAVDKALIIVGKMEGRHISLGGVGDISGLVKELLRKGR